MKSVVAIIFLILPSVFLGIKCRFDYELGIKRQLSGLMGLAILASYMVFILVMGVNGVVGIESNSHFHFLSKMFFDFFVLPGIGISLILFPKVVVEMTNKYASLKKYDLLRFYSGIGWGLLAFSIVFMILGY